MEEHERPRRNQPSETEIIIGIEIPQGSWQWRCSVAPARALHDSNPLPRVRFTHSAGGYYLIAPPGGEGLRKPTPPPGRLPQATPLCGCKLTSASRAVKLRIVGIGSHPSKDGAENHQNQGQAQNTIRCALPRRPVGDLRGLPIRAEASPF